MANIQQLVPEVFTGCAGEVFRTGGHEEELYIGGRWTAPDDGRVVDVVSPATEEPVGRAALAGAADVDRAVAAARAAFDRGPWPRLTPAERAEILGRAGEGIAARSEELVRILGLEAGSPVGSIGAAQAQLGKLLFDYYAQLAGAYPWEEERAGLMTRVRVTRLPAGVVAAIVPWNMPLLLALQKVVPALMAGCTVVLKPAEETPLHAIVLAEIFAEAGLPAGVLNVVPADRTVSERLVRHPDVDKVSFTGSTAAGRRVAAICGEQIKRCSLELGGKSAAIVLADADLAAIMPQLAPATMMNSGQMCVNQTRVLAPRSRYDDVVEALTAVVRSFPVGDPLDPETFVGPLINERQRERVEAYVAGARSDGATATTGGGRPEGLPRGHYVEPTVFAGVDNGMRIAREEIFGPVAVVIPYADEDEAVAIADDSPYGLSGSVWGADEEHAARVASRVRSGTVSVNGLLLDLAGPFGGFRQSGIGREYGPEALDAFVELQTLLQPPLA